VATLADRGWIRRVQPGAALARGGNLL